MHHATFLSPLRLPKAIGRTALCGTLALALAAPAQSSPSPVPPVPETTELPADIAPATSTRGIFVATVVTLVAQGLGSTFAGLLGGSITRWFTAGPKPAEAAPKSARSGTAKDRTAAPAALHAGLAYEVHLLGTDGSDRAVDPTRHAFRTGDRFQVWYRPALPGRVAVFNIDPKGGESRIDSATVAAGQLAALGPYQFVSSKGEETLRLVLETCSSAQLTATTRAIVKASAPDGVDPAVRIADCNAPGTGAPAARPRGIGKATIEGRTAFALDPLSKEELRSGRIATREVRISLHHR
ncbi:MAG: hypothetical protein ABI699_10030 [Caldimonas sp.]